MTQAAEPTKAKRPTEVTVTLIVPVELKDKEGKTVEKIESLTLRRLKGKDMRAIANASAKGHGEALATLICRSAQIPPSTFDELDGEDVTELGVVAADFIGGALPTGVT